MNDQKTGLGKELSLNVVFNTRFSDPVFWQHVQLPVDLEQMIAHRHFSHVTHESASVSPLRKWQAEWRDRLRIANCKIQNGESEEQRRSMGVSCPQFSIL